ATRIGRSRDAARASGAYSPTHRRRAPARRTERRAPLPTCETTAMAITTASALLRTLCRSGATTLPTKEELDDSGNDKGRGFRPLPGNLLDQGRREAKAARVQGFDRLSRSQ